MNENEGRWVTIHGKRVFIKNKNAQLKKQVADKLFNNKSAIQKEYDEYMSKYGNNPNIKDLSLDMFERMKKSKNERVRFIYFDKNGEQKEKVLKGSIKQIESKLEKANEELDVYKIESTTPLAGYSNVVNDFGWEKEKGMFYINTWWD